MLVAPLLLLLSANQEKAGKRLKPQCFFIQISNFVSLLPVIFEDDISFAANWMLIMHTKIVRMCYVLGYFP
jgi:hypothetical protein